MLNFFKEPLGTIVYPTLEDVCRIDPPTPMKNFQPSNWKFSCLRKTKITIFGFKNKWKLPHSHPLTSLLQSQLGVFHSQENPSHFDIFGKPLSSLLKFTRTWDWPWCWFQVCYGRRKMVEVGRYWSSHLGKRSKLIHVNPFIL